MIYAVCRPGDSALVERCRGSRTATPIPAGLLRRDALAARRPRPARHRSQRAGVGVFQAASRAQTTPGSTATTSWRTSSRRPIQNTFNTTIGRVDYRPGGNQSFFGRFNVQRDTLNSTFPSTRIWICRRTRRQRSRAGARRSAGTRSLSRRLVNTFRYGYTKMVLDRIGTLNGPQVYFRFIDDLNEGFSSSNGRRNARPQFRQRHDVVEGQRTPSSSAPTCGSLESPATPTSTPSASATVNPSWVNGVGRTIHPWSRQLRPARVHGASGGRRRAGTLLTRGSTCSASCRRHRPVQLRSRRQPPAGRRGGTQAIRDRTSTSSTRRTAGGWATS